MESVEGNGAVAESGSYSVGEEGKELNNCEAGFSGNREFGVESIANAITHASKVTDFESARERMVDSIKIEDEFDHFSRVDGKLSSMESTDTDEKASVSERMHKMVESDSLKIEVIDETAVIDTTRASKLENGIGNEKGFVGFAKTDGMKEKRPQRRGKGAEKLSGSNGKEKILIDMDKAQNSLEKEGDGTKRAYSREEVEALRFVNLESQQKKWIEIYCGLAPIVAGEYDGLIACNRQKHIQINFDPRKQSGKKKKTPAVLGEDCFQVMNNETENMIPLDPSCGEDYLILEGECSEEDDSDDDYSSIQRPAFLVTGKPNFNSGPPQDGLEYLRRVRWEAAQIPKVKVSKLETSKLSKEQTVYMPKIPDIAKCPEHLLPLKQWEDAFIADFSELRLVLSNLDCCSTEVSAKFQYSSSAVNEEESSNHLLESIIVEKFDNLTNEVESDEVLDCSIPENASDPGSFSTVDENNENSHTKSSASGSSSDSPTLSAILRMDSVARLSMLRKRISLVENVTALSRNDCAWLFALCAAIDTPLDADTCAALRCLLRKSASLRAAKSEVNDEVVMLNILVTITGKYFGQLEY
ncbi:uncharacterized protein LOC114309532 [Camellia sinensis]|uniref:uncharacterized protein LOC114309532 n=1 Tax=Camellia sinensis TaxID=4442 RepID=UPI00103567B9|nr:uncharacterized protein LOC114309532 [Camellia sinensis]